MSIFTIVSIVIPVVLASSLPPILQHCGYAHERGHRWLLYLACGLFFVSWYVPSPLIDGQDTAFNTHFIGGGIFTGCLWLYLKYALGWRRYWLVEAFSLFALVSALGCMNELFELLVAKTGIARLPLDDTNWDIAANTAGALLVWLVSLGATGWQRIVRCDT